MKISRVFSETLEATKKIDIISALTTSPTQHSLLKNLYIYKYFKHYYGYIIVDPETKALVGIDCGDYKTSRINTERIMKQTGGAFTHLFLTHTHENHAKGAKEWLYVHRELSVVSGTALAVNTLKCDDGQIFNIGNLCVFCMHTPGHSTNDVSYVVTEVNMNSTKTPLVFTGDVLYIGGCGKVVDGSYEGLYNSLMKLRTLPNETLIFPGHENALENIAFAKMLEPNNEFVGKKLEWAKGVNRNMSLGTMMSEERLYNPFLRCDQPFFKKLTGKTDNLEVFRMMHAARDKLMTK